MAYKLVWSDSFDKDGEPDPSKWVRDLGGHGGGNNEAQYYTDALKNCRVEDGKLIIEAHKESYENKDYTSGKLMTKGLQSFKYGKCRIKAKLPGGLGSWSAIWFMPDDFGISKSWPACGEIDFVEHIGRKKDMLHFSLHTESYNHKYGNEYTSKQTIEGLVDQFAVYEMIWDEDKIQFLVNDVVYTEFTKGEYGKNSDESGWPFDKPYYLIINLAIGGYWGGAIDDCIFPLKMEIDFVEFYQLSE